MYNVLVIDDDKTSHAVIKKSLGGFFNLNHAMNGEEGLVMANELKPDVIILDVEMPGKNGYEVCDAIKHKPETSMIPVIFLSSLGGVRDRMQGYESGGSDYIVKPFVTEDLIAKISILVEYHQQNRDLQNMIEEAQRTAFIAMSGSSELGQAMSFVEKSQSANNIDSLMMHFNMVADRFALKIVTLIQIDGATHWFSNCGSVSPLERELMTMLDKRNRFFDFGCRTQINYPHISVLVKNMPLEDMERYGRIKDILPAIISAANTRIVNLTTEDGIKIQTQELNKTFSSIQKVFVDLTRSMQENQQKGVSILRHMLAELSHALPSMGLEEDQENFILDSIEKAVKESSSIVDTGNNIKQAFDIVLYKIQGLAEAQNQLVTNLLSTEKEPDPNSDLDDVASVELF